MFEVRDGAGFEASRSCDAMAISTWPSRGLKLMGFEIKESRADWLREYRNPEKADTFFTVCDEWYLVVGSKGIVQPDELPESWGLLERNGNRLVCVKQAPKLKPEAMDRSLLAAMLKRAIDTERVPVQRERDDAYDRGRKAGLESAKSLAESAEKRRIALAEKVHAFEMASGLSIEFGDIQNVGKFVDLVRKGGHKQFAGQLDRLHSLIAVIADDLRRAVETAKAEAPNIETPVSA